MDAVSQGVGEAPVEGVVREPMPQDTGPVTPRAHGTKSRAPPLRAPLRVPSRSSDEPPGQQGCGELRALGRGPGRLCRADTVLSAAPRCERLN